MPHFRAILSMLRRLALFDLDNTLLAGDSDHAWGEFLIAKNLVDETKHRAENDKFYKQYQLGDLDIHAYVKFSLSPILKLSSEEREKLHKEFMREAVEPMMLEKARALVDQHKSAGDICVIITATNEFITTPIAEQFQVSKLLATDLEVEGDCYTGSISGIPCYQSGKVAKLDQWLQLQSDELKVEESIFYSDSINDLDLMNYVATPIAVDPDIKLRQAATDNGWDIISLRG